MHLSAAKRIQATIRCDLAMPDAQTEEKLEECIEFLLQIAQPGFEENLE